MSQYVEVLHYGELQPYHPAFAHTSAGVAIPLGYVAAVQPPTAAARASVLRQPRGAGTDVSTADVTGRGGGLVVVVLGEGKKGPLIRVMLEGGVVEGTCL